MFDNIRQDLAAHRGDWAAQPLDFAYADGSSAQLVTTRTISVTASDGDGGATTVTRTVTVNNVVPTATVGGAATAAEGSGLGLAMADRVARQSGAELRLRSPVEAGRAFEAMLRFAPDLPG